MSVVLISSPRIQLLDENGAPLVGAKLYTQQTGTTTPVATYTSSALTVAHANPIISDANGFFPAIYPDPDLGAIKFRFFDAGDVNLGIDTDPVFTPEAALTQAEVGAALYPITDSEDAAGVTPTDYAYPPLDMRRYGFSILASAATNTTALNNALAIATSAGGGKIIMPVGIFPFNGTVTIPSNVELIGATMGFGSYSSTVLNYTGSGIAISYEGYYSKLSHFKLMNSGTGTVGIKLIATQTQLENVTVMPENVSAGFSVAGIQADPAATTFTHLMRRVYVYGNVIGIDAARGNNFILDACFIESNGTNIRIGNASQVVNFVVCNGSVIELFGDGRAEETNTSVSIDVQSCLNFVCRDSYFEINGTSTVAATGQRGIKLGTVGGGEIAGNYFYGGSNFSQSAKSAINVASDLAKGVNIHGNHFESFNTTGVEATVSGSLTQLLFGINSKDANTPFVYDNTWTPVLRIAGAASAGATYATNGQVGRWQREGDRIIASCYMELTAKGSGTGAVGVGGLPASSANVTNLQTAGSLAVDNTGGAIVGSLHSLLAANTSIIGLAHNATGTRTNILDSDINNGSKFWISIEYSITA
jgi:hypothetical protein